MLYPIKQFEVESGCIMLVLNFTFYSNHVVLPATEQTKLKEKKDLNIERLEAGLTEYNDENKNVLRTH
jgi:hypothetical protein